MKKFTGFSTGKFFKAPVYYRESDMTLLDLVQIVVNKHTPHISSETEYKELMRALLVRTMGYWKTLARTTSKSMMLTDVTTQYLLAMPPFPKKNQLPLLSGVKMFGH